MEWVRDQVKSLFTHLSRKQEKKHQESQGAMDRETTMVMTFHRINPMASPGAEGTSFQTDMLLRVQGDSPQPWGRKATEPGIGFTAKWPTKEGKMTCKGLQ